MEEIYFIESGRKRRGKEYTCKHCALPYVDRANKPKSVFCSRVCSIAHNKVATLLSCAFCHKQFEVAPSKVKNSKSGLHFCCRLCKDQAQRIGSGFGAIQPNHYGSEQAVAAKIQKALRDEATACENCGYAEVLGILQVHHIDRNRENNDRSNLTVLCPNCHATAHYIESTGLYTPNVNRMRRKVAWPEKEKLKELLLTKTRLEVGAMFGVSGSAVANWIKQYGLPAKFKLGPLA